MHMDMSKSIMKSIMMRTQSKFAPVVTNATIHIILILVVMAGWWAKLLDMRGAFWHDIFEKGWKVDMEIPQGFERFYP